MSRMIYMPSMFAAMGVAWARPVRRLCGVGLMSGVWFMGMVFVCPVRMMIHLRDS